MNRFAPALRKAARELDLPRPLRDAILLEMASDLEAAYEDQRGRGHGEAEAARRAEEIVLGSPDVVRRLARLHAESWRDWADGLGERLSGGVGLVLLGVAVIPMFLISGSVGVSELLDAPASPLIWTLLLVGAAVIALLGLETARQLRGRRPSGRRLTLLLLLSTVAPAVGLLAFALGLRSVAIALSSGSAEIPAAVELSQRLGRDGALLSVGLLLGISGALGWFVMRSRAAVLAARETDALLREGSAPDLGSRSHVTPLARRREA